MKLSLPIFFLLFFFPSAWSMSFNLVFLKDYFDIVLNQPNTNIVFVFFNETYDIHLEGEFINENVKCSPDRYLKVRVDYIHLIEYAYLTDGFNNSFTLGVDYVIADPFNFIITSPNITFDFWIRNITYQLNYTNIYPYLSGVYGVVFDLYPTASATVSIAHASYQLSYSPMAEYSGKNFKTLHL